MTKAPDDGTEVPASSLPDEGVRTDLDFPLEQATHKITQATTGPEQQKSLENQPAPHLGLSSHEVQHLLHRYATLMAPNMPFAHLPPNPATTASFTESPFLLRAILVVTHFHDTSTQQTLMHDLIQQLTTAIFTSAEKSLDLLQALLILCTWYNPHLFHTTSHATLLHLCMRSPPTWPSTATRRRARWRTWPRRWRAAESRNRRKSSATRSAERCSASSGLRVRLSRRSGRRTVQRGRLGCRPALTC